MKIKLKFFHATVTTVLLYGSYTCTLKKELEKKLDGCYTKMLRVLKMYHGSNTWEIKWYVGQFQRSRLLLLPKAWDSVDTAGVARMNLPINYYYGNKHMAKELGGDQDKNSLINCLMTWNCKKKILQMQWMTESIGKAKLWIDCGQSDDDELKLYFCFPKHSIIDF